MKVTKSQLIRIIKEEKRQMSEFGGALSMRRQAFANLDPLVDYLRYVEEMGHITPVASSVIASYADEKGLSADGNEVVAIAQQFGIDPVDVRHELARIRAESQVHEGKTMKVTVRQLRRIIREAQRLPHQRDDEVLLNMYRAASLEGTRIVVRGEKGSLYAGVGNTEGLHDFADVLAREKWQKSGSRFVQKLKGLIPGNVIQGMEGRNRFEFGTWTPQLQAMAADLNTAADLKTLIQASWD